MPIGMPSSRRRTSRRPRAADHHDDEHEHRREQGVEQPRPADGQLDQRQHRAEGDEPVVDGGAAEDRPDDQHRRPDEPEEHVLALAAQRARSRPHSSQCTGSSGGAA